MGDNCANRRALLGFRGFLTITAIGFAITLTFFVDETESARETKGLKSVKSNKVRRTYYISVNLFLKLLFPSTDKLPGCLHSHTSQARSVLSNDNCLYFIRLTWKTKTRIFLMMQPCLSAIKLSKYVIYLIGCDLFPVTETQSLKKITAYHEETFSGALMAVIASPT